MVRCQSDKEGYNKAVLLVNAWRGGGYQSGMVEGRFQSGLVMSHNGSVALTCPGGSAEQHNIS